MRQIAQPVAWIACLVCLSCGKDIPDLFGPVSEIASNGGSGGSDGGPGDSGGGDAGGGDSGGAGGETPGTGGGPAGSGGSGGVEVCENEIGPCDPYAQCGCNPGQVCDYSYGALSGTPTTKCVAGKNGALSTSCNGLGACIPGASCVDNGCKKLCKENADCDAEGAVCYQVTYQAIGTKDVPGMKVCTDHCEPWDPASCGKGLGCVKWSELGISPGTFSCIPAITNPTDWCYSTTCSPGYECRPDYKCHKWCRIGESSKDCPAGETCAPVSDKGKQGYFLGTTEVGVCQ